MNTYNNYRLKKKLYQGNHTVVYRSRLERDDCPRDVILKILEKEYPTPEEVAQFRLEYEITRRLGNTVPGVIKAYGIEKYKNSFMMILEDFGAESLAISKQRGRLNPNPEEFLHLALDIAGTLAGIHRHNVIHKDINPANIIRNPGTKRLKIIDFGISSLLPGETVIHASPCALTGTPAYISPEQTGRVNRPLDFRTDFYSLGITFYELLTSRLPFAAENPMEMLHAHIAATAPAPSRYNPEIPRVISGIIMKLMAKNAEGRYLCAPGLIHDLQCCLDRLTAGGKCRYFRIGSKDVPRRFQIPRRLYGREKEIEVLRRAHGETGRGTNPVILVAGEAGMGKTSLVREACRPAAQERGYFIEGKYGEWDRDSGGDGPSKPYIPYAPLVRAFRDLVRRLSAQGEEQIECWKAKIVKAVGKNTGVIIAAIPELEAITGKQEPVPPLPPIQTGNRFSLAFENFVRVFASPDHPLTLFLDGLERIDSPSLKLVERLIAGTESGGLFLIGAFRSNEANPVPPPIPAANAPGKKEKDVRTITLGPLGAAHVNRLIADTLHRSPGTTKTLAQLCLEKTGGNPFFLKQFLHTLYRQKSIRFHGETMSWRWDIEKIRETGTAENAVDFPAARIRALPGRTQHLLQLAAALGRRFSLKALAQVTGEPYRTIAKDLWAALRENLINPLDEECKYALVSNQEGLQSVVGRAEFEFDCDTIRRAAYSLTRENKRAQIYPDSGRLLWGPSGDGQPERYVLTYGLYKKQAELECLQGNFQRARDLVAHTLDKARSSLEIADLYVLLIEMYAQRDMHPQARETGRKALQYFGIRLQDPEQEIAGDIPGAYARLQRKLQHRTIAALPAEPEMKDPQKRAALKVLYAVGSLCYPFDYKTMALAALEAVNLTLDHGQAPEVGHAYAVCAMVTVAHGGNYQQALRWGKAAIAIGERFRGLAPASRTRFILTAAVDHWGQPLKEGNPIIEEGIQECRDAGELQYAAGLLLYKNLNDFYRGKNIEDILAVLPDDLLSCNTAKNQWAADALSGLRTAMIHLQGERPGKPSLPGRDADETRFLENCRARQSFFALSLYMILKAGVLYLYGHIDEAEQCIARAGEGSFLVDASIAGPDIDFYRPLIAAARYRDASNPRETRETRETQERQKALLEIMAAGQSGLKTRAENCPGNFLHKYLLVEAEIARVRGQNVIAMNLYDRAAGAAAKEGFIQIRALAAELAAKFYLELGLEKIARLYMTEAHYGYTMWGAKDKARSLETAYPHLLAGIYRGREAHAVSHVSHVPGPAETGYRPHTPSFPGWNGKSETGIGPEAFDLMTFTAACRVLSSETSLEKFLQEMMRIVIESAGAERGFFLRVEGESRTLIIEAAGSPADPGSAVLQSVSLEKAVEGNSPPLLCRAVIDHVVRTGESVILHDAAREGQFILDEYVKTRKPKSVLCMPLRYRGGLTGILYLENNILYGAFAEERVRVLDLLAAQMAVSLENTRVHQRLEELVGKRTAELRITNEILRSEVRELRSVEKKLVESEKHYRDISGLTSDYIYEIGLDGDGRMVFQRISEGFTVLTGYTLADVRSPDTWHKVIHRDDLPGFEQMLRGILSGRSGKHELRFIKPSGDIAWFHISGRPRRDEQCRHIIGIIGAARDITERKLLQEQLHAAAITDELTGICNRRGFFALAEQQCELARRSKQSMSLIYLDIDDMKTINDRFGHQTGDQALMDTATLLKNTFRKSDIIGRIGGDEFAVLLTGHTGSRIEPFIIHHIRGNFRAFNGRGAERKYRLFPSIGIAVFDPVHPCSLDDLLIRADAAMYEDKKRNKFYLTDVKPLHTTAGEVPGKGEKLNKRGHRRYEVDNRRLKLDKVNEFEIKNISIGGICLRTNRQFPRNNIYSIELPHSIHDRITVKGSVVWSSRDGCDPDKRCDKPLYETGLRFLGIDDRQKRPLEKFIREITA